MARAGSCLLSLPAELWLESAAPAFLGHRPLKNPWIKWRVFCLGPWRDGSRGKAEVGVRGWGDGLETTFCLFVCELAIFEICLHGLDPRVAVKCMVLLFLWEPQWAERPLYRTAMEQLMSFRSPQKTATVFPHLLVLLGVSDSVSSVHCLCYSGLIVTWGAGHVECQPVSSHPHVPREGVLMWMLGFWPLKMSCYWPQSSVH